MANQWQIKIGDRIQGPFTDSQLDQLIRSGRVVAHTSVRPSENTIWRNAGETVAAFRNGNRRSQSVEDDAIVDEVLLNKPKRTQTQVGWQIRQGDGIVVPVSVDELSRMIESGKVDRRTPIRQPGLTEWRPVESYPEFFQSKSTGKTKICPYCAEQIQTAAVKCKHCGEYLDGRVAQQRVAVALPPKVPAWNPGLAAMMSFLFPGMGQIYKGQPVVGIVCFFLTIAGYALFIVPGVGLHIWIICDAYSSQPKE